MWTQIPAKEGNHCSCFFVFVTFFLEHDPSLFYHQAAKEVAKFLGTVHHSYEYTIQEGLDAISEVSLSLCRILHRCATSIRCIMEAQRG